MSNDRSERLRQRRRQSREKGEPDETDKQPEPSKPSEIDEPDKTGEQSDLSVKDERVGTYMYLTEEQKKDVNYLFRTLQAEYEREFGEEFEKNRHFYPLVVKYGLDSLDSLDVSEVRERLDELGFD